MMFQKAERRKAKLKLAMTGPSGSGKTYSALMLAKGLGEKIAVIDTENGSASLYADKFDFEVVTLTPPFTVEKFYEAIKAAVAGKFDVLIIDSLSHAWAGEGGLLEQKEALDSRGGKQNTFTNWAAITKKHEKFKSALLQAPIHVIATMRSKQDYVLTENNGKQTPKKVGMAPIQREGMEYEFTTVFDIAMDHSAEASKDRTGLFADKIFRIDETTGKLFTQWLESAKEMLAIDKVAAAIATPKERKPEDEPKGPGLVTGGQVRRLFAIMRDCNWTEEMLKTEMLASFNKEGSRDLTFIECDKLISKMERNPVKVSEPDQDFPWDEKNEPAKEGN